MLCQPLNIVLYILEIIGILRLQLSNSGPIHQNLQYLVRMQFSKLALIFWLCALAYAQSPVGSSGSGDTGSTTGNGNSGSSGAASSGAYPSSISKSIFWFLRCTALKDGIASSSTMSISTVSSTTSPSPSASKASSADGILNANLAVVAGSFVALGVAAMM